MKTFKNIIEELTKREETIATMESCTGGGVANAITNEIGASQVIKYSAITYANESKIMMGVDPKIIDEYTVYSIETAREMASAIVKFAHSDMGVGVTGKLNNIDPFNDCGEYNQVYVSIYYKNKYYDLDIEVDKESRSENKNIIIEKIIEEIEVILNENEKY